MIWILFISMAFAEENWFCSTESSQVIGRTIQACGHGSAKDEDSARAKAFKSAQNEFKQVCDASTFCKGMAVKIEPKRTTCEQKSSTWNCTRMVSFEVGTETAAQAIASTEYDEYLKQSCIFWHKTYLSNPQIYQGMDCKPQ